MVDTHPLKLEEVVKAVAEIYKSAKLIGTVVVIGGSLSLVLALVAATPVLTMESYEFVSLTCLSGLLIVVGCALPSVPIILRQKVDVKPEGGWRTERWKKWPSGAAMLKQARKWSGWQNAGRFQRRISAGSWKKPIERGPGRSA
jgi:hypothetical protein